MKRTTLLLSILIYSLFSLVYAKDTTLTITKKYLNLPVSHEVRRARMELKVDNRTEQSFVIRLAPEEPDYWVFFDMSQYFGKEVTICYEGDRGGIKKIYQDDQIQRENEIYQEYNRPQFHFTTKRGWINDPNGLVYYDGEYHLFYQHNPYERLWENMHWGHAVSTDLVHWQELPVALYPDKHGTMYSGSIVIDYNNTAGFNKGNTPAMIAYFTTAGRSKQVQGFAYSLDNGRSWTKYSDNPVLDTKEKWNSHVTRDPKVFWYEKGKHWVMVLFERDGHSIYSSDNLKKWNFESHVSGLWECPELFELPIDGNKKKTKWVMYGASGTYMIGSFDGKVFTPEKGKYFYTTGTLYAAQTFNNIPKSDGRVIQIGYGRNSHPDMPFNGQMLIPTELTLRTTKNGVRLFSNPVEEFKQLLTPLEKWTSLSMKEANEKLGAYSDQDILHIRTSIKLSHTSRAQLNFFGQSIINYDMSNSLLNNAFYSPEDMTSMELSVEIFIDKTSIEVFIDGGAYSYSMERKPIENNKEGFLFVGRHSFEITNLEVYSIRSIWQP